MNPYWSYLLTAVGVFGLWLAGRKDRRGWIVGIGAQVLWIAYATATHQWGFYFSALAYGFVYAKNAHAWKSTPQPLTERAEAMLGLTRDLADFEMPMAMGIDWPPPPNVRTSVCGDCATHIFWQECPTGGWWIHHRHPEDGHDARPATWAPPTRDEHPWHPVCRYCGADCSEGRSWDGGDLYACPSCAERRVNYRWSEPAQSWLRR